MGRAKIEFATPEDVTKAFAAMNAADLLRLEQFARFRAKATPWLDWRDLIHTAVERSLSGGRRWPMNIPFIQYLRECVRSISNEELRHRIEGPITTAADLPVDDPYDKLARLDGNAAVGPERRLAGELAIGSILRVFASDPAAIAAIAGLAEGLTPAEICKRSGIDQIQYESAQKRIRRWALRTERGDLPESTA